MKEKSRILESKDEVMTRLDLLLDKRVEYVNKYIELNVWAANNPSANASAALQQIADELDALDEKIKKLRNE